jgi:hypothetical protein
VPVYLVERWIPRVGELTAVELKAVAQQSLLVQQLLGTKIQWLQSVITSDGMLCLFMAAGEAIVREHARLSGLPIARIGRVTAVLNLTLINTTQEINIMSDTYTKPNLEARIAKLEDQLKKQDRKIRLLGTVATIGYQALFRDPLKEFFDAPEFWEVIYEDNAPCHNACYQQWWDATMKLREKEIAANDRLLECRENCGDLFPFLKKED